MNRIRELFGTYCDDAADLKPLLKQQICPYTGKKCYKTRKSAPETSIGTCTVHYQNDDIIICPNRLLENNQVFMDCLHLLTLHEPGNELFIIPEVSIPGGNVDYFLTSARDGRIMDFVGIELQTLDTTGTIWPERQKLLHQHGIMTDQEDISGKRAFGMNWKMTAKTILLQMHHKAQTFAAINKHLAMIIQKPFWDYIHREFVFSHIQGVRMGDPVHIHAYDLNDNGRSFRLSMYARISTDADGIAKCLGLNASPNVELEQLSALLEQRLRTARHLTL